MTAIETKEERGNDPVNTAEEAIETISLETYNVVSRELFARPRKRKEEHNS